MSNYRSWCHGIPVTYGEVCAGCTFNVCPQCISTMHVSTMNWGSNDQTPVVSEVVHRVWQSANSLSGPLVYQAGVSALEEIDKKTKKISCTPFEKLDWRENKFCSSSEWMCIAAIKRRHSAMRPAKQEQHISWGTLWSNQYEYGKNMSRQDGKPTSAL